MDPRNCWLRQTTAVFVSLKCHPSIFCANIKGIVTPIYKYKRISRRKGTLFYVGATKEPCAYGDITRNRPINPFGKPNPTEMTKLSILNRTQSRAKEEGNKIYPRPSFHPIELSNTFESLGPILTHLFILLRTLHPLFDLL